LASAVPPPDAPGAQIVTFARAGRQWPSETGTSGCGAGDDDARVRSSSWTSRRWLISSAPAEGLGSRWPGPAARAGSVVDIEDRATSSDRAGEARGACRAPPQPGGSRRRRCFPVAPAPSRRHRPACASRAAGRIGGGEGRVAPPGARTTSWAARGCACGELRAPSGPNLAAPSEHPPAPVSIAVELERGASPRVTVFGRPRGCQGRRGGGVRRKTAPADRAALEVAPGKGRWDATDASPRPAPVGDVAHRRTRGAG